MPTKIIASEIPCCDTVAEPPLAENVNLPLLSFSESHVTGSEILDAISILNPKKTEDYNGVSMFFIKHFKISLFSPLQHIINRSLVTGLVPQQIKLVIGRCLKTIDQFHFCLVFQKFWKKLLVSD